MFVLEWMRRSSPTVALLDVFEEVRRIQTSHEWSLLELEACGVFTGSIKRKFDNQARLESLVEQSESGVLIGASLLAELIKQLDDITNLTIVNCPPKMQVREIGIERICAKSSAAISLFDGHIYQVYNADSGLLRNLVNWLHIDGAIKQF